MTIHTEKRALAILREWAKQPREGTSCPWWAIVKQGPTGSHHEAMLGMVAGPFLSRFQAQTHLDGHPDSYPKNAIVFCFSGYQSLLWRELWNLAVELAKETEP